MDSWLVAKRIDITSSSALDHVSPKTGISPGKDLPLDTSVLSTQTARDWGQLGIHELYNLLEVVFSTAKVCFANGCLALPSCTPSHLPQHGRTNKVPSHSAVVKNYSSCWPVPVSRDLNIRTDRLADLCQPPDYTWRRKRAMFQHRTPPR
jgi:hypothetical protein